MSTLNISDLAFAWPDGTGVFDGLDATLGPGRIGLVGRNGSGKTTLMRLIAGDLKPDRGSVTVTGRLGYLRQDVTFHTGTRVDEILGIAPRRAALHRIESGDAHVDDFDVVGADWDIEERALAVLAQLGLGAIAKAAPDLDRTVATLSGGETVLLALCAQLLAAPDVLLLDEPTNNLDRSARERLYAAVARFTGTVLVISHDLELLDRMDEIAELRVGRLRRFGGNYSDYERIIAEEQEAARAAVRDAERDVRRQGRELVEAQIKLDRRQRYAKMSEETHKYPGVVAGIRKMDAQVSAGKLRGSHQSKLDEARATLAEAESAVRDDDEIRVDLPDTQVFPGQQVVELDELHVVGPDRIAVIGDNGAGKTTLLHLILATPPAVECRMLPQRLDIFDENASVADNLAARAPDATAEEIRGRLARFLFRKSEADAKVATLSGGERLRAALAVTLWADPAPRLLLLDEPTNNLDLPSRAHLTQAIAGFRGVLIVASHDLAFLRELAPTRWLRVTDGRIEESAGELD